jgi:lipoyl(octanoyl) transferase
VSATGLHPPAISTPAAGLHPPASDDPALAPRPPASDDPALAPHPATGRELWVCQLGVVDYREALALQERLRDARQRELIPDVLLCLEHPPVYTRGRRSGPAELPMGEQWYLMQGIEVVDTDRGGRVTYHGPGQLVGYPIIRTVDVVAYVRTLERALIAALAQEGIAARARVGEGPAYTGVWVDERKIASIGVHVSRGVTTHGFALNVANDLQPFAWIVPCGLDGVRMTSVIAESGGAQERMSCLRKRVARQLAGELGLRQRIVTPAGLQRAQRLPPASETRTHHGSLRLTVPTRSID